LLKLVARPERLDSGPVRKEARRARRRAEIVAAARGLVAAEGLEALTFGALEDRLDFTRGVITYHFRDKDELVEAVLDSAVEEVAAAASAAGARGTPEERLRGVLRAVLGGFLKRPEAGRVLFSFWSRLATSPRIRARNARLYGAYRRQAARLLREGMRSGAFARVPAEPLAAVMVSVVLGLAAQSYFAPGALDAEAAIDEAARSLLARLGVRGRN